MDMNAWYWHFLETYIYRLPIPPQRIRTKPMEVICVGFPRSGTESLQQALLRLGYDYTYHGWDILFEESSNMPGWVELGRRKFYPSKPEHDAPIPAEAFDKLIGHAVALTDAPASCFARDLVYAYPEAKVVLNVRADKEAWKRSAVKNLVGVNENMTFGILKWFDSEMWWMWHVYERILWYAFFRSTSTWLRSGVDYKGKMLYEEHSDMVRGMMGRLGRENDLLEWEIGEGWEPLCKFLGKEVPRDKGGFVEAFPKINDRKGFQGREEQVMAAQGKRAIKNLALVVGGVAAAVHGVWWKLR